MIHTQCDGITRQRSPLMRRRRLPVAVASALAAMGIAIAVPAADARITKIEISSRTHRLRRLFVARRRAVREDRRQGVRRGRPRRSEERGDRRHRARADEPNGKVEYSFDFYILKPIDLTQGQSQGDVRAAQSRRQDVDATLNRVPGGNDPGAITDPDGARQLVPDAARLHDRVERLGQIGRHRATRTSTRRSRCRSPRIRTARRSPGRRTNTS